MRIRMCIYSLQIILSWNCHVNAQLTRTPKLSDDMKKKNFIHKKNLHIHLLSEFFHASQKIFHVMHFYNGNSSFKFMRIFFFCSRWSRGKYKNFKSTENEKKVSKIVSVNGSHSRALCNCRLQLCVLHLTNLLRKNIKTTRQGMVNFDF